MRPAQGGACKALSFRLGPIRPSGGGVGVLQGLVSSAGRFISDLGRAWIRERNPTLGRRAKSVPATTAPYPPLRRLTLTDEVSRTLFEEYAVHRRSNRGDEETGWTLLGIRDGDEAIILATLARRGALQRRRRSRSIQQLGPGAGQSNPSPEGSPTDDARRRPHAPGQPETSKRRRLPGRPPWVSVLRGGEGVFGIGTVDQPQPGRPHVRPPAAPARASPRRAFLLLVCPRPGR